MTVWSEPTLPCLIFTPGTIPGDVDALGQRVGLEPYPDDVRGQHPYPAPACGVREPDPPPEWLAGTLNGHE
jgi:hypothetical protein